MNDEKMKELMVDYVEGRLDGELKEFVEKQMAKRDEIREEVESLKQGLEILSHDVALEPDSTLKLDFDKMLHEEMSSSSQIEIKQPKKAKLISIGNASRIAAAIALLISGTFIGWWISQDKVSDNKIAALEREMEATKQMVLESLDNQNSASTRLNGVNVAHTYTSSDAEIIDVLINTMASDENTNVRLAAARALARFKEDPAAIEALINGITTQNDPVVQIELINIMVELKETKALQKLEQVIDDDQSLETVKDEAHMALYKLS